MSDKVLIEVDAKDSLVRHIEDLQRVIAKRNKRIAELEQALEGTPEPPAIKRAYRAGWEACANATMVGVDNARRALDTARRDAFDELLRKSQAAPMAEWERELLGIGEEE